MSFPIYNVTVDLPLGYCQDQLHEELVALSITGFEGVSVSANDCKILFSTEVSAADKVRVTDVLAAHNPLSSYKLIKHSEADDATRDYLHAEYSAERQTSLLDLRVDAIDRGYANRKLYIDQFRAWLYNVVGYHKTVTEPAIEAATSKEELDAVVLDLPALLDASKPSPRVEVHIAASIVD